MYHIRKHLEKIKHDSYANVPEDFGVGGIDCSLGINPFGIPEGVVQKAKTLSVDLINHYPHGDAKLKSAIMEYWNDNTLLNIKQIELAGGSIDAITKINKMFIDNGTAVLGIGPQFPDLGMDVEVMGGVYETVDMSLNNGKFDGKRFSDKVERRHAFCYIDNPNNPTGQIIPIEIIADIAKKVAKMGVCVIVDEAYGDFMDKENSAVNLLDTFDNVMVLKSFSKGFGMAGMRVGYTVGHVKLMDVYRKVSVPFCVSGMGAVLAMEALKDDEFLAESRRKIAEVKEKIIESTDLLGNLETSMTVPIMTLIHPDRDIDLYEKFLSVKVLTVPGDSFEGLGKNCVRFRIGPDAEALIERIKQI